MKISIVSGGFDPIHSGHIAYLEAASKMGDILVVLLNNDEWLIDKKGSFFMPFEERSKILKSLEMVDEVHGFQNDDKGTCINGLKMIKQKYKDADLVFCNGGDRNAKNIPEMLLENIEFAFEVGGEEKLNSSSWILKKWSYPQQKKVWGEYFDLFKDSQVKVKELIIDPNQGMSFQRHKKRDEFWLVSAGSCKVYYSKDKPENKEEFFLEKYDYFFVKEGEWHQIINESEIPCHIIEIQYGEETEEDDIERLFYYGE